MRIKIPVTHKLRVKRKDFDACAKGHKRSIVHKRSRDFNQGDDIVLMEYTGTKFTGREITGAITEVNEKKDDHVELSFRKWSITSGKD